MKTLLLFTYLFSIGLSANSQTTAALLWGTYYGGVNDEEGNGIAKDNQGNIYIAGGTASDSSIATPGAYQIKYGGGTNDAFLAKFNSSGALLWATYFGGPGSEFATGVAVDDSGNVYITGNTTSSSGIASPGAFDSIYTGVTDAVMFLAKFAPTGSLDWSTYYEGGSNGSSGVIIPTDVAIDAFGNPCITGYVYATYIGFSTSGTFQPTYDGSGLSNAFLVKFNAAGIRQWATFYGGKEAVATAITADQFGHIYMTGSTYSSYNIAIPGAYKTTVSDSSMYLTDAFLAKFDSTGNLVWGTYYGGNNNDQGNGVALDNSGNVVIAGYTLSSQGIATANTGQPTYGGGTDAFIAKFDSSGGLLWGTYYGGSKFDQANSVSVDTADNILITGNTKSANNIATAGAYSSVTDTIYGEVFLAVFSNSGALNYGSYYGGPSYNIGYGMLADDSINLYITGGTVSLTGIATPGAYQAVYGGGGWAADGQSGDAFLTKFNFGCSYNLSVDTFTCTNANDTTYDSVSKVVTGSGCDWAAIVTSGNTWLSTSSSGSDRGQVSISVQQNSSDTSRTGTINVNGQVLTIIQPKACTYSFDSTVVIATDPEDWWPYTTVQINADSGCCWTAKVTSGGDWLSIPNSIPPGTNNNGFGCGSGGFTLLVDSMNIDFTFTGTIDVNGQTITIILPEMCSYAFSPENFDCPSADSATYQNVSILEAGSNCQWDYLTSDNWLSCSDSGTGNGEISITVQRNDSTSERVGIISFEEVAALYVFQPGYTGISTVSNDAGITVFPNPSTGEFYFKGIKSGSTLEVYDVLGQDIYSTVVSNNNYLMNLAGNAKGIYFYRIIQSTHIVQQGKIVLE